MSSRRKKGRVRFRHVFNLNQNVQVLLVTWDLMITENEAPHILEREL